MKRLLTFYLLFLPYIALSQVNAKNDKPDNKDCPPGHVMKEFNHGWKCVDERTTALPVELIYFKGSQIGNEVVLFWSTASEKDCSYYAIEGSGDDLNFEETDRIPSGSQNSSVQIWYQHKVKKYPYYRLVQIDLDGTRNYYQIIYVPFKETNKTEIWNYNVIGQKIR